MKIRNINKVDLLDLFNWRNDHVTRSMSINQNKISFKEHEEWFLNSFNKSDRKIYIGLLNKIKVGVCRFDYNKENNISEVSINMNPLMRKKKLSNEFLNKSIKSYIKDIHYNPILLARINKKNSRSLNIFEKNEFIKTNEVENFFYYEKKLLQKN